MSLSVQRFGFFVQKVWSEVLQAAVVIATLSMTRNSSEGNEDMIGGV